MVKFLIFNKIKKIYLTRSLIINSLALICVLPLLVNLLMGRKVLSYFSAELGIIACLLILIGIITKIVGQFRYEKLKGFIRGTIELHNEKIIVNENEYLIEEIKKIEVYGGDYKGKWISKHKTDFGNALSNGVENAIKIVMENEKETVIINFLQTEKREIKKAEKQLINYHKMGKIHWLKLIEILDINDYDEIQKFKSTIR